MTMSPAARRRGSRRSESRRRRCRPPPPNGSAASARVAASPPAANINRRDRRSVPILWLVIILGIVEGVTEYLPVSSTGHLILATELLGYDADAWALFNIAIQPGAILAILVLYWRTFRDVLIGLWQREASAFAFVRNLLVAFVPAVVVGLAIGDSIELLLGNAMVVAVALILGGFAILLVEWWAKPTDRGGVANVT